MSEAIDRLTARVIHPEDYPAVCDAMDDHRLAWMAFLQGESDPSPAFRRNPLAIALGIPGADRRWPTQEQKDRMDAARCRILSARGRGNAGKIVWKAFKATLPGYNEWWKEAKAEVAAINAATAARKVVSDG